MATSIPPHNAAELCEAALHLIKHPNARTEKLVDFVKGPDFPTGGTIVETREAIIEAYETGRGGFRVRAKWEQEDLPRGLWQIVVTEIPYQVQKSKLVEKIAELLQARKLPLIEDVRDESAEEIRLVLVPRAKTVDPQHLMESLYRATELENRISLNMNVLSAGQVPRVMSLRDALRAWLEHRKEVLVRRSNFRLDKIEKRLEVLEGYLKAYLNLDEVIRIIREEDEPKPALIKRFKLTDNQAEAILNMRLRSLRKLEEMEIKGEHKKLTEEQKALKALVRSEDKLWARVSEEIRDVKTAFGKNTPLGKRRTIFADAPKVDFVPVDAMIEREPITVVCSKKGWIRSMKGHLSGDTDFKFKEGDGSRFMLHAETTDKLLLFATDGRFYTLDAARLPGGRGNGEPVRLMIDLDESHDVVELFVHRPGRKLIVASHEGNGFIVPEDEVVAMRRAGKQVLNVTGTDEAVACATVQGTHVAVIGENRKLLIFPVKELNEMTRGKGVRLQRYAEKGLADIKTFTLKEGLTVYDKSGRARTHTDLKDWVGARAQAGRLPPRGFTSERKFGGPFGAA